MCVRECVKYHVVMYKACAVNMLFADDMRELYEKRKRTTVTLFTAQIN